MLILQELRRPYTVAYFRTEVNHPLARFVASVAMHHEEDAAWTRHRAIPPMEAYAILGRKRHILTLEPHGVPITVGIAGGDKDQTLFKHHGAPHEQQRRSHHANGDMKQAPALADHRTSGWW